MIFLGGGSNYGSVVPIYAGSLNWIPVGSNRIVPEGELPPLAVKPPAVGPDENAGRFLPPDVFPYSSGAGMNPSPAVVTVNNGGDLASVPNPSPSYPTSADVGITPAVTSTVPAGSPTSVQGTSNTTAQSVGPGTLTSALGDFAGGLEGEVSGIVSNPSAHLFALAVIVFLGWWFFFRRRRR